ncbi:helix-turn-helix transcriptional regulator [Spirillospora sp. NBC_00431]
MRTPAAQNDPDLAIDWRAAHAAVDLISGKWDLLVVAELTGRPRQYNDLLHTTGLDGKQLTRALRRLQNADLVKRMMQGSGQSARVFYSLTPHGRRLFVPLHALAEWWAHSSAADM